MKTTVDIADGLFRRAKALAKREGRSFKDVVEEGVQLALSRRQVGGSSFVLPDLPSRGGGVQKAYDGRSWGDFIEISYGKDDR